MSDIAWSIEHSVETTAPLKFAWLFMTSVKNWDDPPAEFHLNGPFVNGTTGTTEMPGQPPRPWRLRDVESQSTCTLEILLEGAAILCKWTFSGTAEGHTRLTQRITLEGASASLYKDDVARAFEASLAPGMARIAKAIDAAHAREGDSLQPKQA